MTDTYNDTTGSRKKFLIPLVVLLLCAVSLTGAGYAYNSSVQDNGTSTVDERFTIDLLDPANTETVISGAVTGGNIDGLVLTVARIMGAEPSQVGTFVYEKGYTNVVLYKGAFKVESSQLNKTGSVETAIITDEFDAPEITVTGYNTTTVAAANQDIKYFTDVDCTDELTGTIRVTVGQVYYYQLVAEISGTVTDNTPNAASAKAFAIDVLANTEIAYTFKLIATPDEYDYKVSYELDGGNGSALVYGYNAGAGFALPANNTMSKEGFDFAGWFTDEECTVAATDLANDATGNVTFYAKWTANP